MSTENGNRERKASEAWGFFAEEGSSNLEVFTFKGVESKQKRLFGGCLQRKIGWTCARRFRKKFGGPLGEFWETVGLSDFGIASASEVDDAVAFGTRKAAMIFYSSSTERFLRGRNWNLRYDFPLKGKHRRKKRCLFKGLFLWKHFVEPPQNAWFPMFDLSDLTSFFFSY